MFADFYRRIFLTCLLVWTAVLAVTGATPILDRYVCEREPYGIFIYDDIKAGGSDSFCGEGTEVRAVVVGDGPIGTASAMRLESGSGPSRVQVTVYWTAGRTGTLTVKVQFRRRNKHSGLFNTGCYWSGWEDMYDYQIHRGKESPGANLTGKTILNAPNSSAISTFSLNYKPATASYLSKQYCAIQNNGGSPTDQCGLIVTGLKYFNGQEDVTVPVTRTNGYYNDTPLTYVAVGIGSFPLKITALVQIAACAETVELAPITLTVESSCYRDDLSGVSLTLSAPNGGGAVPRNDDGSFSVDEERSYTILVTGLTDFSSNYHWTHDGGVDLDLQGDAFTLHKEMGSYHIEAVPNVLGCPMPAPINIVNGGGGLVLNDKKCTVVLPRDLAGPPFNLSADNPVFKHFAATVASERSIIVMPGVTLELGAELRLDDEVDPAVGDLTMNFIENTSYDEYGRVLVSGRSYFDAGGQAIQNQSKNLTDGILLASGILYDAQGRVAINTLTAPTGAAERLVCEGDKQDGQLANNINFKYNPDFVTASATPYDYKDFDEARENDPLPLDSETKGTLGYYYGNNNVEEPYVAATKFPYVRTMYKTDGSGEVRGATRPGDMFKAGSPYLATTGREPVDDADPFFSTASSSYLSIRNDRLQLPRPATVVGEFFKTVAKDEMGKQSVVYTDKSGKSIISAYYGTGTTPITTSFQFFDNAGRVLLTISPKGLSGYTGSNFADIDKTTYEYDGHGRLKAVEEKVNGKTTNNISRTEYIYRKDGALRFSQNQEQRDASSKRYSYTNYDAVGRPIESGEFEPNAGGELAFRSTAMTAILEDTNQDGGLSDNLGTKRDKINTFYDEIDPELPGGRTQRFVQGAVSRTQQDNVSTSWYSYDEQGRVEWIVRDIEGLGVKTIDYRYGPTGVQEVLYQKGKSDEQFTHYYEYDADGRLKEVYTTRELLTYDRFGKLNNDGINYDKTTGERISLGPLEHQATYYYYPHGPIKRVEYATREREVDVTCEQNAPKKMTTLQGIDYLYMADGSLKAINDASSDPLKDPGKDGDTGSMVERDVFGITLDYFSGDYSTAKGIGDNLNISSEYPDQFTGLIRDTRWHGPVESDKTFSYAYQYDMQNQFANANWGTVEGAMFIPHALNSYHEEITGYDVNGNIQGLKRNGNILKTQSAPDYNLTYSYKPYSNLLAEVSQSDGQNTNPFRSYDYNGLGQLTHEEAGTDGKYIDYDVTGKMTAVYSDEARTQPVTKFSYDDLGMRLSKTSYDENYTPILRTWYVRDVSGQVASIYEQDLVTEDEPIPVNMPIYGSGKIGMYMPQYGSAFYELTDHLGNVRAVVGDKLTLEYLATMESERNAREEGDDGFINIIPASGPSYVNHTPATIAVECVEESVSDPGEVNRINNGMVPDPVGAGMVLWVHPGDVINAEVFAKYANFEHGHVDPIPGIATFLTTAFGPSAVIDGVSIFNVMNTPEFAALPVWSKVTDTQPRAFLNYMLFDKEHKEYKYDLDQVSTNAEVLTTGEAQEHERLSLDITVEKEGYLYIWVSNESEQNLDVYFDDLHIKQRYSNIVAGGDYYPFGLSIKDREITREFYRYGYQGRNAEKDDETGWSHFELREYDPVIGRWTSVDPERQFFSPYVGMSNRPNQTQDQTGGSANDIIVTGKNGNYLFTLDDGKPYEITFMTAKEVYDAGYQWFEPLADKYYPLLHVSGIFSTLVKSFTWQEIVDFSIVDRYSWQYGRGKAGDWKASSEGGDRHFLVSVGGMPYWGDAIGQIPFAVDTYRELLGHETEVLKTAREHGNGQWFGGEPDMSNGYDIYMVLRGILYAKERYHFVAPTYNDKIRAVEHRIPPASMLAGSIDSYTAEIYGLRR